MMGLVPGKGRQYMPTHGAAVGPSKPTVWWLSTGNLHYCKVSVSRV